MEKGLFFLSLHLSLFLKHINFRYDQVKICLPAFLRPSHHLLFTFSHVQCNFAKLKKGEAVESVFGYSCLALFSESRILQDGAYELPVISIASFPRSRYLETVEAAGASASAGEDGETPMFGFHSRLVSTLYMQDPVLADWFAGPCWPCDQLSRSSTAARVRAASSVFPRLWEALCCAPTRSASQAALMQAASLAEAVAAAATRGRRASLSDK